MYYDNKILDGPDSVNVSANSPVLFSCTAVADTLLYYVNGTSASLVASGLTVLNSEPVGTNKLRRNLTLTAATATFNNTEIYCRAKIQGDSNDSNIAVLLVQGIHKNMQV